MKREQFEFRYEDGEWSVAGSNDDIDTDRGSWIVGTCKTEGRWWVVSFEKGAPRYQIQFASRRGLDYVLRGVANGEVSFPIRFLRCGHYFGAGFAVEYAELTSRQPMLYVIKGVS